MRLCIAGVQVARLQRIQLQVVKSDGRSNARIDAQTMFLCVEFRVRGLGFEVQV